MSEQISKFLQERIDAGDFPSAVYLVAEKGEITLQGAVGFAVVEPERIEAKIDTIYDLASLTKVLVTGLLTAYLIENGEITLDDRIADHLLDFDVEDKHEITIAELVTHTSNLQGWKPLYLFCSGTEGVVSEIARTPFKSEPDGVTYSDLNFILLGKLIERITGRELDDAADEIIFSDLGLKDSLFAPFEILKRRIAASENGNGFEKQTCIEKGYLDESGSAPVAMAPGTDMFRHEPIWGEVHDGNAYFMGGVAGHAGLFSTAEETLKIAQQFLPNFTTLLNPETCGLFRTNFTKGMNEGRSLAFQLASTPESTAGTKMSPESFGHLGFTGTSLWIDTIKERVFILLTNRTHNHALPFVNINSVRRRFHDLAIEFLDKNS